jgi:hypothetical protein
LQFGRHALEELCDLVLACVLGRGDQVELEQAHLQFADAGHEALLEAREEARIQEAPVLPQAGQVKGHDVAQQLLQDLVHLQTQARSKVKGHTKATIQTQAISP